MRFGWGKLVVVLVMSVAVLQIVHMLLLSRLEGKGGAQHRRAGSSSSGDGSPEGGGVAWAQDPGAGLRELQEMMAALQGSAVTDGSGDYKIVNFVSQSDRLRLQRHAYEDVTLVTQCSPPHLRHLPELARTWDGPVSVAVFATKDDVSPRLWPGHSGVAAALLSLAALRRCSAAVRANVSFHLVYPLAHHRHAGTLLPESVARAAAMRWTTGADCDLDAEFSSSSDGRTTSGGGSSSSSSTPSLAVVGASVGNYAREELPYPNNLLRNVARRNALTEFVLVSDADMLPNHDLHADFLAFADTRRLFSDGKRDDKTVYVVPAFEARAGVECPRDKAALLRLIDSLQVRPFYFELCWKCQKHTDYDAWQRGPLLAQLQVVFEVLWKDPWEPFYIVRNSAPLYDERFRQYGFNRISQVCELHIAGFRFSVLNNAFLVHRGLKTVDSFHRRKDEDQERNRLLFRQFKAELKDKYPDSSRRCY